MGESAALGPFVAEDSFLRHVANKRYMKKEMFSPNVFDDRHETLSFTFQTQHLHTDEGLDQYHEYKELPSGDLPGLCILTFHDLTVSLQPPLPPRQDPNPTDKRYGHLHCCTDRPADDAQRRAMAHLAKQHGIVRPFVPKKKRKDLPGKGQISPGER